MVKHTSKILRYSYHKIFKVCHERIKQLYGHNYKWCSYSKFFGLLFSPKAVKYGPENSEYGHFSCSEDQSCYSLYSKTLLKIIQEKDRIKFFPVQKHSQVFYRINFLKNFTKLSGSICNGVLCW